MDNTNQSQDQTSVPPRITQDQIMPGAVKQRHLGEGNRFIRSGLIANRPTTGEPVMANSSAYYYATDQHDLSLWNGKSWDLVQDVLTGTAAARPTSGAFAGQQYFATNTAAFSVWDGAAWQAIGGGSDTDYNYTTFNSSGDTNTITIDTAVPIQTFRMNLGGGNANPNIDASAAGTNGQVLIVIVHNGVALTGTLSFGNFFNTNTVSLTGAIPWSSNTFVAMTGSEWFCIATNTAEPA